MHEPRRHQGPPVLSNGAIVGKQRLTEIQKAVASQATTAGINGDFFSPDGRPSGILMRAGALDSAPTPKRSSIGLDSTGLLHVDRISYNGYWKGAGQRRPLHLAVRSTRLLGIDKVTNYDGSWTEWGNLVGAAVEKGAAASAKA